MSGPLDGITVVELATTVMAPYGAQILGDLGARVVKIETFGGDPNRSMGGGGHKELSGVAVNLHRNKKSIALDPRHQRTPEVISRILLDADVFLTNYRPAALAAMGLDFESLHRIFPRLIYVEAHGFLTSSGLADEPAYDDTIQALTGLPLLNERVGSGVHFPPILIADKVAGLHIVQGTLAALFTREKTGLGQRVEIPMFNSVLAFTLTEHLARAAFPGGEPGYSRILTSNRGPHKTLDGWLAMMPYLDRHWENLFKAAGCEDLLLQPWHESMATRLAEADTVYAELKAVLSKRTTSDWLEVCRQFDIPVAELASLEQLVSDPAFHHGVIVDAMHPVVGPYRQVAPPIVFYDTPTATLAQPAPLIGENGQEILRGSGYDDKEIEELFEVGAVRLRDQEESTERKK